MVLDERYFEAAEMVISVSRRILLPFHVVLALVGQTRLLHEFDAGFAGRADLVLEAFGV
jgi:hypothetical protein